VKGENYIARVLDLALFRLHCENYIASLLDLALFRHHCENYIARVSDLTLFRRHCKNYIARVSDLALFRRHCEKYCVKKNEVRGIQNTYKKRENYNFFLENFIVKRTLERPTIYSRKWKERVNLG
jgi:hypothetical protein